MNGGSSVTFDVDHTGHFDATEIGAIVRELTKGERVGSRLLGGAEATGSSGASGGVGSGVGRCGRPR